VQTAAGLVRQDQLPKLAVPEECPGRLLGEENGGGAMNHIDQDQRDAILADFKQWKVVGGLKESKIYNFIQQACRLWNEQPKIETTDAEVEAETVKTVQSKPEPTGAVVVETSVPILLEREAKVQKAWEKMQAAAWERAVAITEIHDSKCYPGSEEKDGWRLTCWRDGI
jgi:hypothetical protein